MIKKGPGPFLNVTGLVREKPLTFVLTSVLTFFNVLYVVKSKDLDFIVFVWSVGWLGPESRSRAPEHYAAPMHVWSKNTSAIAR